VRIQRIAGLLAVIVLAAACSSSTSSTGSNRPGSTVASGARGSTNTSAPGASADKCARPQSTPPTVTPVSGSMSDKTLTSFDGARIRLHWFPLATATAAHPAPTILMGPGWGSPGDTNVTPTGGGLGVFGALSIYGLHQHGYNVLTWDPRGFGESTGTVTIDDPQHEGRDVSRMLDWIATQPGVQLDAPGDPRAGMTGGSYGGGIQLAVAATDCRVDAIVPWIAWHSLGTSLYKSGVSKTGWGNLLYGIAATKHLDPHIRSAEAASLARGAVSAADEAWFVGRGPGPLINRVKVPTLFVQGTVDTLFSLDEAITNYKSLLARNVPTAMLWYCGGHGVCLTPTGNISAPSTATLAWLDHYVQRKNVPVGPGFSMVDQRGVAYSAPQYPVDTATTFGRFANGTLNLVATGGSGPAKAPAGSKDPLAGVATSIMPARATNAVNVKVGFADPHGVVIASAPSVKLVYSGTAAPGDRPTAVFAQLVDDTTGLVIGNQVTPIAVTLDGKQHTVTVPLEAIAFTLKHGSTLTLQIVATTVAYAQPRLGGKVTMQAALTLTESALTPR
jgi:ABC-2 type transport system ATP-binding protein